MAFSQASIAGIIGQSMVKVLSRAIDPLASAETLRGRVMPQMPGPQLAKQLLARQPSLRVLLMSGFAQPILDSGGHLDAGMAFIEKPFSGPSLLAKIAQTLERVE